MSKRNADVQITKDDAEMMSQDSWGSGDAPKRASAAQMAGRKLARPRGARRPVGAGATSASMQQSFPPFGQTNGAQQTPSSMFRPSTNINPQMSQSFPQFSTSINNDNSGSNNSFSAPTGSFNFSTATSQNPFASSNQNDSTPIKGFHGSIFNFDTPAAQPETASGNTNPLFAPGAPDIQKNAFEQPKPANTPFSWPSATQQSPASNNLFSMTPAQQPQTPSLFANSNEKSNGTVNNLFAGFGKPTATESTSSKPDISQQLAGAPPSVSAAQSVQNPFAAITTTTQNDAKSNPFANIMQAPKQTPGSSFVTTPSKQNHSTTNPFAQDSMQTSPDNTPAKVSGSLFQPFAFTPQPSQPELTSPTKGSSKVSNVDLFGKSFQAQGTDKSGTASVSEKVQSPFSFAPSQSIPAADGLGKTADTQTSGRSLFDRISKSETSSAAPVESSPSSSQNTQALSNGLFAQIADSKTSSTLQDENAARTESEATPGKSTASAFNLFGNTQNNLFQPNAKTSTTSESPSAQRSNLFSSSTSAVQSNQSPQKSTQPSLPAQPTGIIKAVDSTDVPEPPSSFTADERRQIFVGWRLRRLEAGIEANIAGLTEHDIACINRFHTLKRKTIEEAGEQPLISLNPPKKAKNNSHPKFSSTPYESSSSAQNGGFQSIGQSTTLQGSTSSKRKADDELSQTNENSGNERLKRSRGDDTSNQSQTANIFSSILDKSKSSNTPTGFGSSKGGFTINDTGTSQSNAPARENGAPSPFDSNGTIARSTSAKTAIEKTLKFNPFATSAAATKTETAVNGAIKPPTFTANPTNFMAQFGAAAKQHEEEEKKKRKAEDFDSDEDNEEEWEKRDAEQQQLKRQKIQDAAKSSQPFVPMTSTTKSQPAPEPKKPAQSTSIFDQIHPAFGATSSNNIFGHLQKKYDGSEAADVESESEREDQDDDGTPKATGGSATTPARNLFDRVSEPSTASLNAKGSTTEEHATSDHTWKADSPIKFTSNSMFKPTPSISVTSSSSSQQPAGGLFGAASAAAVNASKPTSGLFANLAASATGGPAVGFGFAPAKGAAVNLAQPSPNTSRATSPGATTGESATESANETTEDTDPKQEQLDLMAQRPGEENEDIVFEAPRVKAWKYNADKKTHESQGVGPLRVLKHRETGKVRVIVRQDPNNSIIINSSFVKDGRYEFIGQSRVRCVFADRTGSPCPWQIQTKDEKISQEMAKVFADNQKFGV